MLQNGGAHTDRQIPVICSKLRPDHQERESLDAFADHSVII